MDEYDKKIRERERRRKKREEEKRARRKRNLIAKCIMFVCLLVVLAALLFFARRLSKRNAGGTVQNQSGAAAETSSTGSASTEEEAISVPEAGSAAESVPEVSSKKKALRLAKAYATQYDYDRAIAVLQKYDGSSSDSDIQSAIETYTQQKAACRAVDVTTIPHVFFHSLINDDRGLTESVVGHDRAWRNDAAMTTANEFDHIIEDMYKAGYVMVSLDDMCIKTKDSDGVVHIKPNTKLMLPEGKKAFVLSEDDLSYYHTYGIGTQGYATKMLLDKNGEVKCEYTDENGDTKIGDYDVVPRMDTFIKKHPDFSYHGHKGTVAMTGYDGVFGYRTNDYYKDINNPNLSKDQVEWLKEHPKFNWKQDVRDATAVANAMKKNGWTFASHTYGHWNATEKSAEELKQDNERWMKVNHKILGDTDKIIFAFGGDIGGAGDYTPDNAKYAYFKSQGYNIFCNVDGNIGWTQFGDEYMRTGRVALDGFTMYQSFTEDGNSHATYAHDYEVLGITDVQSFFNKNRITPIEGE